MENLVDNFFERMDAEASHGCAIGLAFDGGQPERSHFSYPKEFLERYDAEKLAQTDHTLKVGFANDGIFFWSDLVAQHGPSPAFEVAAEFGMTDGVCIAVTVMGRKSIASISTDPRRLPTISRIEALRDGMIAATYRVASKPKPIEYSPRTVEWIQLAAQGLSDQEISEQLNLTIFGARARRNKAVAEIGGNTPAGAVSKAHRLGLL